MPSYAGKKKAGTHSTIIDEAKPLVRFADSSDGITKIAPGFIKVTSSRESISHKFAVSKGCIVAKVHGRSSVQEIRLYSKNVTHCLQLLEEHFS